MIADPISDFIIRLQNASRVGKTSVSLSPSKLKMAIAQKLLGEGYLAEVENSKKNEVLTVALAYKSGKPVISGVKRLSKPSRRLYVGARDVRPVKRGHGVMLLSTPKGIMTGKEAREAHVGGEVLFEIW